MNNAVAHLISKKTSTTHIVHLILTLCTLGLWVIVWLICAVHTSHVNYHLDKKIEKIMAMEAK